MKNCILIGIYEYFDDLYNYHFEKKEDQNTRNKIEKINNLFANHEEEISNHY